MADTLSSVIADLARTDDGVDLFTSIMTTKPAPAHLRAPLLTPEKFRSIAAHLVTVTEFKEAIISAVLPHVHKAVTGTSAVLEKRASEPRPMDATPLHAEMMTFINEALRDFQPETVVYTHNHVYDGTDDMRRTFPTLVSTAVSTVVLVKNAHGISHPEPALSSQDHPPMPLSSHSPTPKNLQISCRFRSTCATSRLFRANTRHI